MTRTGQNPWRQWMPAAVAAGAIGAAALVVPLTANAAVDLPDKTAAEVLELVRDKSVDAFSGTVEQTSNLGLPDLSALGGSVGGGGVGGSGSNSDGDSETSPASAAVELLTGSHTAQVFVSGKDQARLQVLDQLDERNVIRNGNELWYYNSDENEAFHAVIEDHQEHDAGTSAPNDLADRLLAKIDPTTEVTVGSDRMVAGRAVYDLVLTPRSADTLVQAVSVAVDGETGLPLGVTVTADGSSDPAFSSTFTDISYAEPDAGLFTFTPPEGATVTEIEPEDHGEHQRSHEHQKPDGEKPTVIGEGWDAVVVLAAGQQEIPDELAQLSTPVESGRLVSTTLVNVLITDDGRILAGSVTPERLQAVAAQQ
ncbi:LolA family protein [Arthrobacter sp. JZ12]|uniref:LolA family protein n=1 Tax=Arthrobacter sp. JZ12 TaxID=2654190 RepID=UPI002B4A6368|nr:sigma-E factor regulatory protein RseB domain-containing protein [Arthrobacter sp. JZ12]